MKEVLMKRLLAAFAMASMLVFSQASPALGLSGVRIWPASQSVRMCTAATWNISWQAAPGGWSTTWYFYFGDGRSTSGTTSGNFSLTVRHVFPYTAQPVTYTQTLNVNEYGKPWQTATVHSTTVTYGYCS
jgi:hypothetical protein